MKKKRITYGVYGMMEYQALIKIGKATLKVLFTDGSLTAFGQNPAKYTTSDFLVQHAIENSSDFKRGRITVVNSTELDEEVRIERNPAKASAEAEAQLTDAPTANAEASVETPAVEAGTASEAVADTPSPEEEPAEGVTEVEFTDNQEAKDYLAKNFGVKASSLRNREDIKAAGETYGVKITFINEK